MTAPASLAGKVALITGGASGIGLGMAQVFGREGMTLVLADIDAAALDRAAADLRQAGATVLTAVLDVRDRDGWAALVRRVDQAFGGVWLLCNNAGVSAFDRLAVMPAEAWDWLIGINLTGVFNGVNAVVPGMIARGQGGHVVNTASMGGLVAVPGVPIGAYFVAKAGVVAMSDKLREEVAEAGIGVSALCPGLVESRLRDTSAATRPAGSEDDAGPQPVAGEPGVLSALQAAEVVLEGVRANRPYIITHHEARPLVESRHAALTAEFDHAAARSRKPENTLSGSLSNG